MVYTNRTDKCLATEKDNAGQQAKSQPKSSSSSSSGSNWSSQASSADKWKYNNMVKDDRDKFNSLHFS